jgi:hypothetical protein
MNDGETVFYRSSNGDRYLVREPGSRQMSVRHQPNRASGGRPSTVGVFEFLSEGRGPQHEALLRLLAAPSNPEPTGTPRT